MYKFPFQVDIDVTNACNYDCIYCCADAKHKFDDELTLAEIKMLVDELYNWGVMDITFAGGEPFLRNDVMDIMEYANQKRGLNATIVTNGSLLTEENLKSINELKNVNLLISFDSAEQQIYDRARKSCRGEENFNKVLANIKYAAHEKMSFSIALVLNKYNISDFYNTYEKMTDIGVSNIVVLKFIAASRGKKYESVLEVGYDAWKEFLIKMTKEKESGRLTRCQLSIACPWEIYLPLIQAGYNQQAVESIWNYKSPLILDSYRSFRELGCHAGVTNIYIAANGDVYPCSIAGHQKELCCGNIREQGIKQIWNQSELLMKLRSMKVDNISNRCKNCDICELCGAGCRIRAFYQTNDLEGEDYLCPLLNS
ncbi:MAG: radical SAM protein [Lachnospiraceae bacterium]|jgi:radical SAM protein with 4Fe4S-binding SPASM domain